MADEIVLYRSVFSRSFTAIWMLEELGVAYRMVAVDIRSGATRTPEYRKLNPLGRVPTLVVGDQIITETPAICIFLGDRYGYGGIAPRIEDPDRGAYLRWLVFTTATLEPARAVNGNSLPVIRGNWGASWGSLDEVVDVMVATLRDRDWLLGDRFSGADVMLGSTILMSLHTKELPDHPVLVAYNQRLKARPACARAQALTWPPELFAQA